MFLSKTNKVAVLLLAAGLVLGLVGSGTGVEKPQADKVKDAKVERLITQLDDDDYHVREAASEALKKLGPAVETALRRVLAGSPSEELRRRITDILQTIAPRYEGQSPGWYWVYGAIAHAQTFKATGDKVQSLELRVARLNTRQPAAPLEVEVRDLTLKEVYGRGIIAAEQSGLQFAWREVKWQRQAHLTPGRGYTLLFHSQDSTNRAPWLINAIYADLYPDGAHPGKSGHDFFFRIKYADGKVLHVGPGRESETSTPISSGSNCGTEVKGALFVDGVGPVPPGKDISQPGK